MQFGYRITGDMGHCPFFLSKGEEQRPSLRMFISPIDKHRPGKNGSAGPNCTVLTLNLAKCVSSGCLGWMPTAQREVQNAGRGIPRARLDEVRSAVYTTNMATPAANIAIVMVATTVHSKRETRLTLHRLLVRSDDQHCEERENNPLMTAVQ
jgi:hypothetical protein